MSSIPWCPSVFCDTWNHYYKVNGFPKTAKCPYRDAIARYCVFLKATIIDAESSEKP
jgi:hypothetical protein